MHANMVLSLDHADTSSLSARITSLQGAETAAITASFTLLLLFPRERQSRAQRRHFQFQQHVGQNEDSHVPSVHSELYFYRTVCSEKRPGRQLGRRSIRTGAVLVQQLLKRQRHKTLNIIKCRSWMIIVLSCLSFLFSGFWCVFPNVLHFFWSSFSSKWWILEIKIGRRRRLCS